MGLNFEKARELKAKDCLRQFTADDGRVGGLKGRVLGLLSQELLTEEEVQAKLKISARASYNGLRRYLKKGLIVAFVVDGKKYYTEIGKAKKEELI